MATVLGRVVGVVDVPRGPDVRLVLHVPWDWVVEKGTIEFELPRTLVCARCDGGGCDTCSGSGAIVVRERDETLDPVRIALSAPRSPDGAAAPARGVTLRLPEHGGTARDAALPRGHLLVTLVPSDAPDRRLRRIPTEDGPTLDSTPEATGAFPASPWWLWLILWLGLGTAFWWVLRR